ACLTFPLPKDTAGNPTCRVLSYRNDAGCDCTALGLKPARPDDAGTFTAQLAIAGVCGFTSAGQAPCNQACLCEVAAASGDALQQCQTQTQPHASASGWCYVSAAQGDAATGLLQACTLGETNEIRFVGGAAPAAGAVEALACSGEMPGPPGPPAQLGEPCVSDEEYLTGFPGNNAKELDLLTGETACASGVCLKNHFQGRASCPYGQAKGSTDCLVAGSRVPVSTVVPPQLVTRQANVASICSCRCAGDGPGPYCTCPESMQCEHLFDDLHLGHSENAGSYCIPKGSQYDPAGDMSECTEPNCGDAHPY
ncbi:MAG TPA: hypothetical protein VGL19_02140, partial [Polyangiaceae bacterium]